MREGGLGNLHHEFLEGQSVLDWLRKGKNQQAAFTTTIPDQDFPHLLPCSPAVPNATGEGAGPTDPTQKRRGGEKPPPEPATTRDRAGRRDSAGAQTRVLVPPPPTWVTRSHAAHRDNGPAWGPGRRGAGAWPTAKAWPGCGDRCAPSQQLGRPSRHPHRHSREYFCYRSVYHV